MTVEITQSDERLVELIIALAHDCENTDGWQSAAPDLRIMASRFTELRGENERLRAKVMELAGHRIAATAELRAEIVAWLRRQAVCGCNGKHGYCNTDSQPLAFADEIEGGNVGRNLSDRIIATPEF